MPTWLARPYPVARLAEARSALDAAVRGDVAALQKLYKAAADALDAMDPDEVAEFRDDHARALYNDQALAHAAVTLADTWEGIVAIGSALRRPGQFRGFAWLAAQVRYELEPARRDAGRLRHYEQGANLPDTAPEFAALYAAIPALIGLGPELPEEIGVACPCPGEPVARLLGLPEDEDWAGVDPIDGIAVTAENCRAHFAGADPTWRKLLSRCVECGLIVRQAES